MSSETKAKHFKVRPRFKVITDQSIESLVNSIQEALQADGATCFGWMKKEHGVLKIPVKDQHYWSPELSLSFEIDEDGKTVFRGMYGPRAAVWTMFMFFYAAIAFAIIVVSSLGFAYIAMDKSPAVLWLIPGLVIIFLSLYFVAYMGQKMSQDQMKILHDFIEDATQLHFEE